MTKDEQRELWVRLSSMPYSGGIVPPLDRLDHGALMRFLDQLAERLSAVNREGTQHARELADLREDIAGLGRVMRLAATLAE